MCAVVHCYFISQHHRAIPKWPDNKFNPPERLALKLFWQSGGRRITFTIFFTRCHDMAQVFVFGDARTCANLQNFVHSENVHQLVMRRMCGASHSNRTRRRTDFSHETADHRHIARPVVRAQILIYIDKIP